MAQYIDKDRIVAEIERIENEVNHEIFTDECLVERCVCSHIKSFIDTLEVKEVNINKEITQFIDANFEKATIGHKLSLKRVAKHFFELGMAERLYETANAEQKYVLEQLFPGLKESEGDRIRKSLIEWMEDFPDTIWKGHYKKDVVSWLEKQGEQKLANKVGSKFKAGDWVVHDMSDGRKVIRQITNMTNESYILDGEGFNAFYFNDLENDYHLWTLQDAKDGDVIFYDNGWACIFKNIHGIWYSSYCFITADGEFHTGYEEHAIDSKINGNANPATKEQRDTFFAKMKDAGFTFDFNKKELKKIEQSSVWSEEDEYTLGETIQHLEELIRIEKVKHCGIDVQYYQRDIDWIKSLKERVHPQPQQEWSEEDEKMVKDIIAAIDTLYYHGMVNWLKSLKDRYTWKPSKEQMQQLGWIAEQNKDNMIGKELMSLYHDLKKLKE